jgi:alpha-N-arabinofuranosidase
VLEGLHEFVAYHSIHLYTGSDDFSENVYQPHIAEFAIAAVSTEIERLRFRHRSKRQIRIAYDEWNVWYRARTAETHLEEHYSLSDALAVGAYLNIFVRHCDVVGMANLAQLVNVIAPIFTSPDGMYLQTIYHPLHLMAEHVQRLAITTWYDGPRKELPEIPAMPVRTKNASQLGPFDVIDVSASRSMDCSTATVSLINRHETDAIATTLDFGKGSLTGTALRFEVNGRDITATNDFGDEGGTYVTETQEPVSGSELQVTLPAHSHTFLKLSLAPTS